MHTFRIYANSEIKDDDMCIKVLCVHSHFCACVEYAIGRHARVLQSEHIYLLTCSSEGLRANCVQMKRLRVGEIGAIPKGLHAAGKADDEILFGATACEGNVQGGGPRRRSHRFLEGVIETFTEPKWCNIKD
jgi:hypothetical protein